MFHMPPTLGPQSQVVQFQDEWHHIEERAHLLTRHGTVLGVAAVQKLRQRNGHGCEYVFWDEFNRWTTALCNGMHQLVPKDVKNASTVTTEMQEIMS